MQLAVSHNNMDFDSLAAQFAVTKLYPTARMAIAFPLYGNVREFLTLYRSNLPIVQTKYIDFAQVSKIFVVDCQHAERLEPAVKNLLANKCPYTIFDHHDLDDKGLGPEAESDSVIDKVGAATTLLVEKIVERNIPLSSFEATLLLLGIYEDTGCLAYRDTTSRDAACAAYLLEKKADLSVVNQYMRTKLDDNQMALLQEMVHAAQILNIAGKRIIISSAIRENYVDGLATITRKLLELESTDAAFCVAYMRDRIHIVGRSDTKALDVRQVIRQFHGDGHAGAASGVIKPDKKKDISVAGSVNEIVASLHKVLKDSVKPEVTASELMLAPVRTIRPDVSMDEAGRIMLRYEIDGLVVADDSDLDSVANVDKITKVAKVAKVVGIVSRRDIDQAAHHKLSHAPVRGFMSHPVISVQPDTPLSEIQRMLVKNDIGRLTVLDEKNNLVGLVSRAEVLKHLYGEHETELLLPGLAGAHNEAKSQNLILDPQKQIIDLHKKVEELDENTLWLFRTIGEIAAENNMVAYAVGGLVRDLLLGKGHFDLDFVLEGSAIVLANALVKKYPDKFKIVGEHDRFQTATLEFNVPALLGTIRYVDLSTARSEFYEYPAALPTVEPSKLEQDLFRRDFTINALALCLNPKNFGTLIDLFNGLEDLKHKTVRVLHQFSFIEDPTRIVRAARFASRFGFTLNKNTAELAKHAISLGIFDNLAGVRMRTELQLILESKHRLIGLDVLGKLGARLRYLDEELEYGVSERKLIRRAEHLLAHFDISSPWVIYLALLLSRLTRKRIQDVLARLHLASEDRALVMHGLDLATQLANITKMGKRSEIYTLLHGSADPALAIAACVAKPGSVARRMIKLYFEDLKHVKTILTGRDLIKQGFSEGPELGDILRALLEAKLDGLVATKEDELKFVSIKK